MRKRLFCFGLGYCAKALADTLRADGWQIAGTTRSSEKSEALKAAGIEVHLFDRGLPLERAASVLAGTTHLLTSIPPDEAGEPVLDQHVTALNASKTIVWAGYLGTTGVYGDQGGAWVDESHPPSPTMPRTKRRAIAEARWLASGLPVHLFRLAGIYGPGAGRNALESIKAGRARRVIKPGQVFGRIHVADIVKVLKASIEQPNPGAIYNVADDEPSPPQDVIAYAAELLGVEPPAEVPFETADLSPAARSFYADSRRVSNRRICEELGVDLTYPTYRHGLKALLTSDK